jgi:hypothetical protein
MRSARTPMQFVTISWWRSKLSRDQQVNFRWGRSSGEIVDEISHSSHPIGTSAFLRMTSFFSSLPKEPSADLRVQSPIGNLAFGKIAKCVWAVIVKL